MDIVSDRVGPMDVEVRLRELFLLRSIVLEKSSNSSQVTTTLVKSVHAVMLESGLVLLDHPPGSGLDKFSYSKKLLSLSLRYTLPELITLKDTDKIESVTVNFRRFRHMVVVHGTVGGSSIRRKVVIFRHRFVPVIKLARGSTLKCDKEDNLSIYREVFVFWTMVKDGIVIPLLIDLYDKAGLELPPCLMNLPTELKLKILESLPGASLAKVACLCSEMRCLASDNDLWKQKCLEEAKSVVLNQSGNDSVDWKAKFARFWKLRRHFIRYHPKKIAMIERMLH